MRIPPARSTVIAIASILSACPAGSCRKGNKKCFVFKSVFAVISDLERRTTSPPFGHPSRLGCHAVYFPFFSYAIWMGSAGFFLHLPSHRCTELLRNVMYLPFVSFSTWTIVQPPTVSRSPPASAWLSLRFARPFGPSNRVREQNFGGTTAFR